MKFAKLTKPATAYAPTHFLRVAGREFVATVKGVGRKRRVIVAEVGGVFRVKADTLQDAAKRVAREVAR